MLNLSLIFPAFSHQNYRVYIIGHFISIAGTWLQIVAQGWLVFQLTQSAFLVGLATAINTLPILLFSLFGGVLVDKFPKKKIIILTSIAAMILALILGILTLLNLVTFTHIIIIAFLLGIVDSIDKPGRKSFIIELVGKNDLGSAIALNASIYNAARVVGPALAGILIATVGPGVAFIINSFSFLMVALILTLLKPYPTAAPVAMGTFSAIKEGLNYSWNHHSIRNMMSLVAVVSIFGWSYITILPVISERVLHLDVGGLGYLYSASGLGATLGALLVSAFITRIAPALFIWSGSFLLSVSIFLFTLGSSFAISLFLLFLSGLGITLLFSTLNTLIQNHVDDSLRGRVMSIYTLMLNGTSPIGSFQIGWLSENFGSQLALQIGALMILVFSLFFFFSPSLKKTFSRNPSY